jgi:nucleotide-binding universal stress UspA family protein
VKNILVAVDGSVASINAGRIAVEIAEATQGSITLVYVVPQPMLPEDIPFPTGSLMEEAVKTGETLLEEARRTLGPRAVRSVCLTGATAESITELAELDGIDLIVVGSKGRGAVSRVLVGSTTDRLVHISRKPVLVVR